MTYSTMRKIEAALVVIGFVGFLVVLGAVGRDDYLTEIGVYNPFWNVIKTAIPGIVLMVPGIVFEILFGDELHYDEFDDEDDEWVDEYDC